MDKKEEVGVICKTDEKEREGNQAPKKENTQKEETVEKSDEDSVNQKNR